LKHGDRFARVQVDIKTLVMVMANVNILLCACIAM